MRKEIGKSYIDFSQDDMDESQLCIDMVYVAPEDRGRHLGYTLLDMAKEYARENGYGSMGLYAYSQEEGGISDEALVEYYRDYGFESDADDSAMMSMDI
jgi:ribosomal protein S18 acetylase RimI-like enzyme